jgi:hypothetical protein
MYPPRNYGRQVEEDGAAMSFWMACRVCVHLTVGLDEVPPDAVLLYCVVSLEVVV